jgi:hypothetical protein
MRMLLRILDIVLTALSCLWLVIQAETAVADVEPQTRPKTRPPLSREKRWWLCADT